MVSCLILKTFSSMDIFIGQDCGIETGGICINRNGLLEYYMTPKDSSGKIDLEAITKTIYSLVIDIASHGGGTLVYTVEDVHSIFGSSASSNFSFGRRRGEPDAIAASIKTSLEMLGPWNVKMVYYTPKAPEWQKKIVEFVDQVREKGKLDTKKTSIKCAMRLFPGYSFTKSGRGSRVPQDGLTDSALICEYGRRKFLGILDKKISFE